MEDSQRNKHCSIQNHKSDCLCGVCKAIRGETKGSNNSMFGVRSPAYKDGRSLKVYYCIDCQKRITYQSWFYGSKKCRSCSNKHQQRSDITKQKMSDAISKKWTDKDYYDKMCKIRKKQMTSLVKEKICKQLKSRNITGLERKVISIIKKYDLDFKYVGDGSFVLHGFNPDFINVNGKKQIIEVFYEYFKEKQYGSLDRYKKQRYAIYRGYGFDTLFIGHLDLQSLSERDVADKIKAFQIA